MQELSREGAEASCKRDETPDKWICRTSDTSRLECRQIAGLWSTQNEPVAELKRLLFFVIPAPR